MRLEGCSAALVDWGSIYLNVFVDIDAPPSAIILLLASLCNDTTNDIMYAEGRRTGLYKSRRG